MVERDKVELNIDKEKIIDSVKSLYTGENKYLVWGVSGLLIITLIALIIICAVPKKKAAVSTQAALVLDEDLLVPDGPQTAVGNVTSREMGRKWDESDEKRFLTVPSTVELDDLSRANDRAINDITEAAP